MLVQDWKQVHFHSVKWLIIFAVIGIPIGLFSLIYGNENIVKAILGVLIILNPVYFLVSKKHFQIRNQ